MKSIIKTATRWITSIWYCKWNILYKIIKKSKSISEYAYSQKYCSLFNCENVRFKRDVYYTRGEKYFTIGAGTSFGKLIVLSAWDRYDNQNFNPRVIIGKNCEFGGYLHLTCINKITIGDNLLTGKWVTISDNDHGQIDYETLQSPPAHRKLLSKGPIVIGNNVWIGDKVSILSGVKIGEGAVIGANAVVTKDIPPYSVAVGIPARIIKTVSDSH